MNGAEDFGSLLAGWVAACGFAPGAGSANHAAELVLRRNCLFRNDMPLSFLRFRQKLWDTTCRFWKNGSYWG
jgi:hypothetical protein